jgi:hypothetical protein
MAGRTPTRLVSRLLLSVLAAAVAVPIAAVGVSAASESIDESRPEGGLELVAAGGLDAIEQAPGAVVERVLTLRNAGTAGYRAIDIGSATSHPVTGLHLDVVGCDTGWQPAATGAVCAGHETLLTAGSVGATATLTTAAALQPGGSDSLLVRLTLPSQSGMSARVTYSAVGR